MTASPGAHHISRATDVVVGLLRPEVGRDWQARAGQLDWTCAETARHLAHDLAKYAAQLAGRVQHSYLNFRLVIPADASPSDVLDVVDACGRLLSEAVAAAPPTARAWHYGPTDPTGFAAMGVGELLVHAHDIAGGLGIDWRPPPELAEVVTKRLFPTTQGADVGALLLWATGRIDLPDRPRVQEWVWRAALG